MAQQYAILIYENEAKWANATPEWLQQASQDHQAFAQANGTSLRGGSQFQPTSTAISIQDGDPRPGPMPGASLALSGYYLIEADNADAATAIAKQVPVKFGGVEVRPLILA